MRAHARALRDHTRAPFSRHVYGGMKPAARGMSLAVAANMLDIDGGRISPSSVVRASISADGLVLLDLRAGVLLASNTSGARIWTLIEQRRTAREIATQLVADYAIPAARAEHDVMAFIAALTERGLITMEPR